MNAVELQTAFLKQIKNVLAQHLTLVDALAEQLNISNDSAYRRIRGEKHLTFDEIQILSAHCKISLDSFLHLQNDSLTFWGRNIDRQTFDFENYLQGIVSLNSLFLPKKNKCIISTKMSPSFITSCFRNWLLLNVTSGAVTTLTIRNLIRGNF